MKKPIDPEQKKIWEKRFQQQKESGKNIKAWCQENGIQRSYFHIWRKRLHPDESFITKRSFLEIPEETSYTGIELQLNDVIIKLSSKFDPACLQQCLSVLRRF